MSEKLTQYCPECDEAFDYPEFDRRDFIRSVGATAAVVGLAGTAVVGAADTSSSTQTAKKPRPAEDLIRELHSTLSAEQKKTVIFDYDHGKGPKRRPTRLGMYNNAAEKVHIGKAYTKAQVELVERIVKALTSGDEGFRQISRGGTWDASRSFDNCGAIIFGDPTPGNKYAFLFTGHHLTIRCDGDSEPGAAFGGPIYYGHSPNGYSRGNLFSYQTRSVQSVYDALTEKQRQVAVVKKGTPGEHEQSIRFRAKDRPGIAISELTKDQKTLVEQVMRDVLKPYRKEDVDEVMKVIAATGGMDKIQLAFYPEGGTDEKQPWSFWRLEGPGFVWNYRVLPHVHTYVNISSALTGAAAGA